MDINLIENELSENTLSVSEIRARLDSLSSDKVKWIKLEKAANYLCLGLPISGGDLLHIVLCKALEGKRKCRKDLPIEVFIYGAMESLIDSLIKKRRKDPLNHTLQVAEDNDSNDVELLNKTLDTPEAELIAKQTIQYFKELFKNDDKLQSILLYQMDGSSPLDIQNKMNLTAVQYASALKAIRRKHEKLEAGNHE